MTAIYGLYDDARDAQRAIDQLKAAGIDERRIVVVSGEPHEDMPFSEMHPPTRMWWIACAGGLAGFAAALSLLWYGQTSWPMEVGGLPVFAWWPNLIVAFEMTMLGAILATVVTLLVSAGLERGGGLYDPDVSEGRILVGVENPAASAVDGIEQALHAGADVRIKRR